MASRIFAKQLTEDCICHSIYYDAGNDCGPVAGMLLTGGRPETIKGIDVVRFEQRFKGQPICIKYDTRPDLAALVAEYNSIDAAKQAAREAKWAQKLAEQNAIDQPLLDAMQAEANRLITQIPAGHTEVIVTKTGDLDGDPILEYTVDGVKLNWQDVNVMGWSSAIRPGALGAFAEICIASISKDRLGQIKIAKKMAHEAAEAQKTQTEAELQAKFGEAKATSKPVLIKSYMADCNDPREECSTDVVSVYAMPDGTKRTERQHTW